MVRQAHHERIPTLHKTWQLKGAIDRMGQKGLQYWIMTLVARISREFQLMSRITVITTTVMLVFILAVIAITSLALGGLLSLVTETHPYALADEFIGGFAGPALDAVLWAAIPTVLFAAIAGFGSWCLYQVSGSAFLSFPLVRLITRTIHPWLAGKVQLRLWLNALAGALSPTAPHRIAVSTSAGLAGAAPRLN